MYVYALTCSHDDVCAAVTPCPCIHRHMGTILICPSIHPPHACMAHQSTCPLSFSSSIARWGSSIHPSIHPSIHIMGHHGHSSCIQTIRPSISCHSSCMHACIHPSISCAIMVILHASKPSIHPSHAILHASIHPSIHLMPFFIHPSISCHSSSIHPYHSCMAFNYASIHSSILCLGRHRKHGFGELRQNALYENPIASSRHALYENPIASMISIRRTIKHKHLLWSR
jgi:hypothetical protein